MNKKLTATLLIAAAVLTNAAFTVLGTVFNYPDVLSEPVEDILAAFRANQTTVVAWFAVMASRDDHCGAGGRSRCRGPRSSGWRAPDRAAGAAGRPKEGGRMTDSTPRRDTFWWSWLIWTAGFLAFPIAGVAGRLVAGRVDSPLAALLAGLVTGAVIGAGQSLVSRHRLRPARWILATALGMGLGLLLGATVVGFRTSLADLALMGALTGVGLGVAQTLALPAQTRRRWWWAVAMPPLWAVGWTVTTLAGIPVEEQVTIFGAAGPPSPPGCAYCSPGSAPPHATWRCEPVWYAGSGTAADRSGPGPCPRSADDQPLRLAAHTKKGRLRGRMAHELLDAHQAGRVSVAIGRASDYFGPRGGAQSNLGDRLFPAVLTGKTARVLGDPDQPHTYTYIPDIGEGLAVLGEHPDAPGQVWHLPNDPNTRTTRQLCELVFQRAGASRARLRRVPPSLLRLAALTNPTVRELLEMQYQFAEPFIVDSTKIDNVLGTLASYQPRGPEPLHHTRSTHAPRTSPDALATGDGRAKPSAPDQAVCSEVAIWSGAPPSTERALGPWGRRVEVGARFRTGWLRQDDAARRVAGRGIVRGRWTVRGVAVA